MLHYAARVGRTWRMNDTSHTSDAPASPGPFRRALPWVIKVLVSGGLLYPLPRQNPQRLRPSLRTPSS